MDFFQHPSNNRVLGAPPGVPIEQCRALPVTDTMFEGRKAVASFWRPSPEELAGLNEGKAVVLVVAGSTHPPLFVGVEQ